MAHENDDGLSRLDLSSKLNEENFTKKKLDKSCGNIINDLISFIHTKSIISSNDEEMKNSS
jgi:hypothetical protein